MRPEKDGEHALVDALDVVLREGAMVQADVLVTVADVPLIGINLRAAVAGMTTMREYGFFENWDVEKRRSSEDRRGRIRREPTPNAPGASDRDADASDAPSDPDAPDAPDASDEPRE